MSSGQYCVYDTTHSQRSNRPPPNPKCPPRLIKLKAAGANADLYAVVKLIAATSDARANEEAGNYSAESVVESEPNETKQMPAASEMSTSRPYGQPITMPLLAGEREFLRGPLTHDSGYRLMVSGEIGAKELGKIIRLLTLQQQLLLEADAEAEERSQ